MKQKLLNNLRLRAVWLVAMILCSVTGAWAQSDKSSDYTGNVNLSATDGTSASTCKVVISSTQYDGIKAGTSKIAGAVKITVPSGTKYLHLHVAAWNNESVTMAITPTGYSENISLTANSGISNNSPFTFSGDPNTSDYYKVITFTSALASNTDLTFTATGGKRFVIWGVTAEEESGSGDTPTLDDNDLALTNAPIALSFDLYNNASAQVFNYTTSSTGAVTIAENEYATFSINETNKTITVTPTAVTPSAQTITVNQAVDEKYKAGSATFTLTITDSTPIPTHTATFSVNGVTSTQDFEEGAAIAFPANPADVSGKTFVGWVATAIEGTTNDAPEFVTSATMGQSDVTYYAVFAYASGSGSSEVVDVLNRELTGVTGTTYTDWSGKTATSSAVYAGQSAGGNESIQLRSNNNNSGIITTTSGGKVKKVSITWNTSTDVNRKVDIYGKNTAYSAATDLYNASTQGTKLGTIQCSANEDLNINDDYEYIGIRSQSGALYLDKVEITWSTGGGVSYSDYCTTVAAATVARPTIEVAANPFLFSTTATITCETEGAAIKYSYDNENWNNYTEALTITATTTIYAKAVKNQDESSMASVTATKNLAEPTVAIDATGITNTNVFEGTAAGSLAASVTYNEAAIDGATVTWSGNNDEVATINASTGAVTLVAAGSVTFTATYAGNSDYSEKTATYEMTVTNSDPNAPGTENNPYTVAQVLALYEANNVPASQVYIKGIISEIKSIDVSKYARAQYYISDNGSTTDQYLIYNGYYLNGADFTANDQIQVGDNVVVLGTMTTYGTTNELAQNNQLVSLVRKPVAPSFSPVAGAVLSGTEVTLSTTTEGAAIYYTLDGSEPTSSSTEYTEAIEITEATTIKAIAVKDAVSSDVATAAYTIAAPVATPIFSPAAGTYNAAQSVAISTETEDATIYYTVDGTTPTTESAAYTGAITVDETMTIKAIAVKDGMVNSAVAEAAYTIQITRINAENVNIASDATSGEIDYTISYPIENVTLTAACTADWISNIAVTADKVTFTTTANTAYSPREANITLSYTGAENKVITVTQARFVLDYATLPFEFTDGRDDLKIGLTQDGLGSDYSSSPKLRFDNTGDVLVLKFKGDVPAVLSFDIKGNSFSGGTFTVQTSVDGETYSDIATFTELGSTETLQYYIPANICYIKWVYTEKVNGNVALGNINLNEGALVKFNSNGYATFACPAALDFTNSEAAGYSAWQVTGVSGETIYFSQITSTVAAGTGILLKGEVDAVVNLDLTESGNDISATNKLVGITEATAVGNNEFFGLQGNQFKKVNAGTIPAGKAVLPASLAAGVKSFTFNFNGVPTGVNGFETVDAENARIFNLAGQRLSTPQKGLNIVNGKKVLVK